MRDESEERGVTPELSRRGTWRCFLVGRMRSLDLSVRVVVRVLALLAAPALLASVLFCPLNVGSASASTNSTTAYVPNFGSDNVSVVDTATDTVTGSINTGEETEPVGVAITPNGQYAYVTDAGTDTVDVIDTDVNDAAYNTYNTIVRTIAVGSEPVNIAITPDGQYAYVVNRSSGNVNVIDTATNTTVGSPIAVGSAPVGVAITPDGQYAYVTNLGSGTVSVIATATNPMHPNSVVATVTVGGNPGLVAITPNGQYAYVPNESLDSVSVIDTAPVTAAAATITATAATITATAATVSVGTFPVGVAITPDGTTAYVANAGSNTVSVIKTSIDTSTDTLTATATTISDPSFDSPVGVVMAPDGTRAYVMNYTPSPPALSGTPGTVSVIATATDTVSASITVGSNPEAMALMPPPLTAPTPPPPTNWTATANGANSATIGYGAQATLSETGLPNTVEGTVSFVANGVSLCSATILSGVASCLTSTALAPGTYSIVGILSLDTSTTADLASESESATLTVNPAPTPPPPSGLPTGIFGTPTSATVSSTQPTSVTSTYDGSSATVSVPAGALPPATTVTVYPVTSSSSLASSLPAGQSYVLSFAVSWETTSGTSPDASAPITMTISDPDIQPGDALYELTAQGPVKVGTATERGTVTVSFTSDPLFVVSAVPHLTLASPRGKLSKSKKTIAVSLRCAVTSCAGSATLSVARKAGGRRFVHVALARGSYRVGPGGSVILHLALTKVGQTRRTRLDDGTAFRMTLLTQVTGGNRLATRVVLP